MKTQNTIVVIEVALERAMDLPDFKNVIPLVYVLFEDEGHGFVKKEYQ